MSFTGEKMIKYNIYPKPQRIEYFDKNFKIGKKIKIEIDSSIDKYTSEFAEEVLSNFFEIDEKSSFLINLKSDSDFENKDAYRMKIREDKIILEGINSDAVFYGLRTLEQVLEQSSIVQEIDIEDYPDLEIRGIVEGYYGIPWSYEDREYLLKFGAKYKNNVFVFAPKDDPYHRDNWDELYPEDELEKISRLAKLGNKLKNSFVWTIAPFHKNPIELSNYEEKISLLLDKFNQLYQAGVRQFGVLGDDVGTLSPDVPVRVMQDLSRWKDSKKDVKDFLYCPASYVLTWAWDSRELNEYTKGFPNDVHLFFTGRNTCTEILKEDVEEFKNRESEFVDGIKLLRKNPLFWLNWPVNDIDRDVRKLYMGPGEMLKKDVDNIVGVVTNPMQESKASLIGIFAISDYSWNQKDFDYEKSWKDSLKIIEPVAHDFLEKICSHMCNADDFGIKNLQESKHLEFYIKDVEDALDSMLASKVKDSVKKLKKEYITEIKSIDNYILNAKFIELRDEIKPYCEALKEKLIATVNYLDSLISFEDGQKELSKELFEKAENEYINSNNHIMYVEPTKQRVLKIDAGTLLINPFLEKIRDYMKRIHKDKTITDPVSLFSPDYSGSKSYRIPSLLKTDKGTLLAFSDKRNEHQMDWGNIDLVVRRREKGNKNFDDIITVMDFKENGKDEKSIFTIDSVTIQSEETNRIFVFTTAFPESKGMFDCETGSGYVEVFGEKHLKLSDENEKHYIVKEGYITKLSGEKTKYEVITKAKAPYRELGDIYIGEKYISNIFFADSPFRASKTSHLLMSYSDDDGKTWASPIDLNPMVKEEWMKFLGVAPGTGIVLNDGRIGFTAYYTNRYNVESSCIIYSDDEGISWSRGKSPNENRTEFGRRIDIQYETNRILSLGECQAIKLNNGGVKLFMRNFVNGNPKNILVASSTNNGESFENIEKLSVETQSWCQLSAIHFNKNDKEFVMISQPSSSNAWHRVMGKIHLFEVVGSELILIKSQNIDNGFFGYSCLCDLGEKFGILYEKAGNLSGERIEIAYREFTLDYILNEKKKFENYKIYPKPKNINYLTRYLFIKEIEFIGLEALDEASMKKAKLISEKYSRDSGKTIVKIEIDPKLNTEKFIDYYEILILNDDISIKSDTVDGAFYGLTTLELILEQSGYRIRNLEIIDYASQKIRGVIEGYYGIPWGNENRADIIKFGSRFKNNVFIFAPKDDPYHREKWYELYPDNEIEEIGKLASLGNELKNRYVWTISPFKKDSNPISPENESEGIEKLLKKFDQLYSVGVRQFGILGDDVGELPKDTVVNVLKAASNWKKNKGDKIYDFVFVPESYVLAKWGFKPDELDKYSAEFPQDVQIMFTGESTCAPVTQAAVDGFRCKDTSGPIRRNPLFWLNWPVNDIDRTEYRRLFMGKGEMLEVGVKNLAGTLTNPLEEPHASFTSIFAIADYSWNSENFDAQRNWEDGFVFIEPICSEELKEICYHMSNSDNGGIEGISESENIKEDIQLFEKCLEKGNFEDLIYSGNTLVDKYQKIINSIETFLERSQFHKLKEEMRPYIMNLYYKSKQAIVLIRLNQNISILSEREILDLKSRAKEFEEKSRTFYISTKTSEFPAKILRAESGTLRINKNIEKMSKKIG